MHGCTFVQQNNMSKEQNIMPINSSILTILFVVFLILKLTDNIDWSWWWVTSPLWIPIVIALGLLGLIIIVTLILIVINKGDV